VIFLALRRGSRFAAQEFAIVATEVYERGVTIPSLRMDISLLGLSTASDLGLSEQDAFLSHLGMCLLTLWELDWPSRGKVEDRQTKWSPVGPGNPEDDREARGILAYIRATHQRSDAGYTLKRMEMERLITLQARGSGDPRAWDHPEGWRDTQRLNRDSLDPTGNDDNVPASRRGIASRGGPGSGPRALGETDAVRLMRVNCRLTLLLREFVFAERGVRTVAEVVSARDEEMDIARAAQENADPARDEEKNQEEYVTDEDQVARPSPQIALEWCAIPRDPKRTIAARLLVAYVSCLTSHPAGLRAFASAALDARAAGIPAADLSRSLNPAEFDVEGSRRGMFGSSADAGKFFAFLLMSAYVAADEDRPAPPRTAPNANARKETPEPFDGTEDVPREPSDASVSGGPARFFQDPDVFAWAPAPGDPAEDLGGRPVATGAGSEVDPDEPEDLRRRTVAGMRASVRAWMQIDRAELDSKVSERLSVDEEDPDAEDPYPETSREQPDDDVAAEFAGASSETRYEGDGSFEGFQKGNANENTPPGDIPWRRDKSLPSNSATIAALTLQRAVVSFALKENDERRSRGAG
jgi:hypothetical protein